MFAAQIVVVAFLLSHMLGVNLLTNEDIHYYLAGAVILAAIALFSFSLKSCTHSKCQNTTQCNCEHVSENHSDSSLTSINSAQKHTS